MRASKVMQDRVMNTPNIKMYWNTDTDEILGDKKVEAVRILNNKTGDKQEIPISGFSWPLDMNPIHPFSRNSWTWTKQDT